MQKLRGDYDLGKYQVEDAKEAEVFKKAIRIAQSDSAEEEERAVQSACEDLWAQVEEEAEHLLEALREIAG